MAHRTFRDSRGRVWEVWEVRPENRERRLGRERRQAARPGPDRRQQTQLRPAVPNDLRQGWLAFASPTERRRLAPIPPDWASMPDAELQRLADCATRLSHALRIAPGDPA